MAIVYILTSPSNKNYIGFTKRKLKTRVKEHFRYAFIPDFKTKTIRRSKIYIAIRKYPNPNDWKFEELYENDDIDLVKLHEQYFIEAYNTIENGYNIGIGGDANAKNIKRSDETKQLITERKLEYWKSDKGLEHKKKLSLEIREFNKNRKGKGAKAWNSSIHYEKGKNDWKIIFRDGREEFQYEKTLYNLSEIYNIPHVTIKSIRSKNCKHHKIIADIIKI